MGKAVDSLLGKQTSPSQNTTANSGALVSGSAVQYLLTRATSSPSVSVSKTDKKKKKAPRESKNFPGQKESTIERFVLNPLFGNLARFFIKSGQNIGEGIAVKVDPIVAKYANVPGVVGSSGQTRVRDVGADALNAFLDASNFATGGAPAAIVKGVTALKGMSRTAKLLETLNTSGKVGGLYGSVAGGAAALEGDQPLLSKESLKRVTTGGIVGYGTGVGLGLGVPAVESVLSRFAARRAARLAGDEAATVTARVVDSPTPQATKPPAVVNKVTKPIVDSPLLQEARKYKSAEEFVQSQGQVVYHGSPNAKLIEQGGFDMSKAGTRSSHAPEDVGIHFTDSKQTASAYSTEYLKGSYDKYKQVTGKIHPQADSIKNAGTIEAVLDIKNPMIVDQSKMINRVTIDRAKAEGYDAIIANNGALGKSSGREYVVFSPDQIKTKSQLTDIWKQAQKGNIPSPEDQKFSSRVFERMQQEHPELEGDLTVDRINQKKDVDAAVNLVKNKRQEAYEIAMGVREAPVGQTKTAISIALAEKALDDGNTRLYSRLTKTRSLEQTRRGQEIVAEKGSVTNNSTARYVKEAIAAKLDKLGKNFLADLRDPFNKSAAKTRAVKRIDVEVAKARKVLNSKKLDIKEAQSFLDSLACK